MTQISTPEQGARLLGAAEAIREQVGASLWPANQIECERNMATLRSMMLPDALEGVCEEGRQKATNASFLDSLFQ